MAPATATPRTSDEQARAIAYIAPTAVQGPIARPLRLQRANAEALAEFTKRLQEMGAKVDSVQNSSIGMTHLSDGFGLTIEITKAQGAYADLSLLEPGFFLTSEGGQLEDGTSTKR